VLGARIIAGKRDVNRHVLVPLVGLDWLIANDGQSRASRPAVQLQRTTVDTDLGTLGKLFADGSR
jgi:hypothetical protein